MLLFDIECETNKGSCKAYPSRWKHIQPDSIYSGQMGFGAQESSVLKLSAAPVRQIFVGLEDGKIEVWTWDDLGRLGTTEEVVFVFLVSLQWILQWLVSSLFGDLLQLGTDIL